VKAFEAIGGRVQVEEERIPNMEITQEYEPKPKPELGPEPKPSLRREPKPADTYGTESEKKPNAGGMVTCPQCGFEQPETDECIKCGIIISKYVQFQEMARSVEGRSGRFQRMSMFHGRAGRDLSEPFSKPYGFTFFSTKFFKKISFGEDIGPL